MVKAQDNVSKVVFLNSDVYLPTSDVHKACDAAKMSAGA